MPRTIVPGISHSHTPHIYSHVAKSTHSIALVHYSILYTFVVLLSLTEPFSDFSDLPTEVFQMAHDEVASTHEVRAIVDVVEPIHLC